MKKLAILLFTAALAAPAFAAQDKPKDQPKTNDACKVGCKMPDDKCSAECMKACAERAKKQDEGKLVVVKHPA
ncbi:MAG TPA: hypothetical protein VFM16_06860 [Holophagaceae bacterium]|nr:hypothetical protein [Holophagaceae bacterium]